MITTENYSSIHILHKGIFDISLNCCVNFVPKYIWMIKDVSYLPCICHNDKLCTNCDSERKRFYIEQKISPILFILLLVMFVLVIDESDAFGVVSQNGHLK